MFSIESDGKSTNQKVLPLLDRGPPMPPTFELFSNWWGGTTIIHIENKCFYRKDLIY